MAKPLGAHIFNNQTVVFGGQDFSTTFEKVEITVDNQMEVFQPAVPGEVYAEYAGTVYTLEVSGLQSWDEAEGFSAYLNAHKGELVTVNFTPNQGGPSWTFEVMAMPTNIGGSRGQWAVIDHALPINGTPGDPIYV